MFRYFVLEEASRLAELRNHALANTERERRRPIELAV